MPTYDYECTVCAHKFEKFQSIKARPLRKCPECGGKVQRLIGMGAAILFKGSGFYETDYRSAEYKKQAKADTPAASKPAETKAEGPTPAKPSTGKPASAANPG